ncbi:MAG: LPS export ABC transporter periplasmic protein LptC [Cyclobacteriaceae bacterium]|nr:LPS export ABC transporter periplasmic protein LptC [Cyclobacteriaceae bacterium]
MKIFQFLVILLICICSCDNQEDIKILEKETFEGPSIEMDHIILTFSDSTKVKIKLIAKKQLILDNNDEQFPEGVYIEFFDENQEISSKLLADKGYYNKRKNEYRAVGNASLKNIQNKNELSTEELIWLPEKEEVRADNFFTLIEEGNTHTGVGLVSDQKFESYTYSDASGPLNIEE